MDKICNKFDAEDLYKTVKNSGGTENLKSRESPVFKCSNHQKAIRVNNLDSSDYDIPSYQVNQSVKSRTSSKYGNDTSESILPFSPIFSPIPVASSLQFQPPSIHSVGTVAKNIDKNCQYRKICSSNSNEIQAIKPCGIFESLGMSDKDISWVSSMATPPPKNVPSSAFNTVERATFIPEEKFQNIQPRALFSPTLNEDSGCHPIIFTSESDDDDDDDDDGGEYKSNIRLSDVCATLKQLEVKSLDLALDNSLEKVVERDTMISPIIKTKRKKLGSVKKVKKGSLVLSPEGKDKYDFSLCENVKTLEHENGNTYSVSNFIEDDSFQSMSFSGIDELCKTLVNEQSIAPGTTKMVECNKTLINRNENNILKKFYSTKTIADVYDISSTDNLHSYAKALEDGDKYSPTGYKVNQPLPKTGIIRFDILNKDSCEIDAKLSHSGMSKEDNQCKEKKLKAADEENSSWENAKHYLSESQLNVSDGEIFRTVENLEKTLASQEHMDQEKLSGVMLQGNNREDTNSEASECLPSILETCGKKNSDVKDSDQCIKSLSFVAFTTASGTNISVSEKALNKAKEILRNCDENCDCGRKTPKEPSDRSDKQIVISRPGPEEVCGSEELLMKGFSTGSGKQIKVSAESLKKARIFMSECEVSDGEGEKCIKESCFMYCEKLAGEFGENMKSVFFTGSEKQVQVLDEVLENVLEFDDWTQKDCGSVTCAVEGSNKKIEVSEETLESVKALMAECDETENNPCLKDSAIISKKTKAPNFEGYASSKEKPNEHTADQFVGFSTSSGKPIQISAEALEKAKSLMVDCEEGRNNFTGFSTGSGKTIHISSEALEKAKSLIRNCEREFNDGSDKLASEWIRLYNGGLGVCTGCGETAKTFDDENKEPKLLESFVSTASGNKLEVLDKCEEKTKKLCLTTTENVTAMLGTLPEIEPSSVGFVTAGGSKIKISKEALAKAKELMDEWDQTNTEDYGNLDSATDTLKTLTKSALEPIAKTTKSEENLNKMSVTSGIYESDDWVEIMPSWLLVNSTIPSVASERNEVSPLVCPDEKSSELDRENNVKSPVLGKGDRFRGKKNRRLRLEEEKCGEKGQSGFVIPFKNSERKGAKRTLSLTLDFSIPFKKTKLVEDVTNFSVDIKAERAREREEQEKLIQQKDKVKPLRGSHLSRKSSEKQMSWREAVAGSSPEVHSDEFLKSFGIREDVLHISIENASAYRFKGEDFFGLTCRKNIKGFPVGDGCLLILDDDNKFGVEELKRAFLASPGVQPNLVPFGWVENHFKWIVWKFVHYERRFPQLFGGRCLTPNHIMFQLKYRYDREIDRSERSAIKKILERDDSSRKRLVLCISNIQKVTVGDSVGYRLELTDGWYSCPALSDPAMTRLIQEGKLSVGTKLVTQGATLVNCEEGVSPLEINGEVYLKISTNSTRRIRWDTKLGFQKNPENFPISLGSILPQGGPISRIDVIVVRIYPTLYMEKTADGRHVTRNRRSEEKADSQYIRLQEQRMESIYNEIQSEMRKSVKLDKKLNGNCLKDFERVEDLRQLVESSSDPSALQELMSADQRNFLEQFQSNQNDRFSMQLREKIQKKLEEERLNRRNVSEFLRAKIVDFRKPDFNNPAVLSVWNPNEDLITLLSEGKVISLTNVTISSSLRIHKPLQINTTRQTQYREIVRNVKYPARKLTRLKDVSSKICPAFEEMDVVGVVALIREVSYGSRFSQVIYLTDLETNFVGIVFWGTCKDYCWENVLRIPSIVACSNLQWKKDYSPQEVPSLYVNENTVFTENPKLGYLKEEIERLKQSMPRDRAAFLSKCEEDLTTKLEESKWRANTSKNSSSAESSPREMGKPRFSNGFESKPAASSTPIKPFRMRMESNEVEPSPIQKRIEKLQSYGEPPPLLPLLVRNNMKRKFKKKSWNPTTSD